MADRTGPDEVVRLLLGTRASRAQNRTRLEVLLASADESALIAIADQHRVLGPIASRLSEIRPLSDKQLARVVEARMESDRNSARAQMVLTQTISQCLQAADVESLTLKGPLMARRIHGEAGYRPSSDVDVLVRASDLNPAVHALGALGFVSRSDGRMPLLHESLEHPQLPPVEVHYRIHWYEDDFSEGLLRRAMANGGQPDSTDELLSLLLFYARDGLRGLRWPADVAALWDGRGAEVDRSAMAALTAEHTELRPAIATAAEACERLVGLPAAELGLSADGVSRMALVFSDWPLTETPKQAVAQTHLVDILLAGPGGLFQALRRTFILPARAGSATAGIQHPLRLLRRFVLGAWGHWRVGPSIPPAAR